MKSIKDILTRRISDWADDEAGEVTIAWVVLTASLLTLSIIVLTSIGGGTEELANQIDTELTDREISIYN